MPLPTDKGTWPPKDTRPYIDRATKAGAWYSGDHQTLQTTSGQAGDTARRRFWQRAAKGDVTRATAKIHAPLAADIAQVSSDLLFGDPVKLTTGNEASQKTLDLLVKRTGLENRLAESAEITAAYGGSYLVPAWDDQFADHPLLQIVDQRHAVPDFRYGILTAVTLWEDVLIEGGDVWRHLERHEPGRILHGLYKGTTTELGAQAPLGDHPATAPLQGREEVTLSGRLAGRLLPSYVPNVLPNRHGSKPIGRSDWDGSDDLLDAVDETWTSMMRDFRLGLAKVIVPQEWLEALGGRPGQQVKLDLDQEAFTGLNMPDQTEQKMQTWQPSIRVTEHIDALLALTERIVSAGGYAPQSFGLQIDGQASSGTSLRIRERKSDNLTSKKQRYYEPGILRTASVLADIDTEVFRQPPIDPETLTLAWPEAERDPSEKATWIGALRAARAMSIDNAVAEAQPHLEGDDLTKEIERIRAEDQVADPFPVV